MKKITKTEHDGYVYSENTLEKSIQSKNLDSLIKQTHEFLYSHKDNVSNYYFDDDNNYNIRFSFDLEMEKMKYIITQEKRSFAYLLQKPYKRKFRQYNKPYLRILYQYLII